MVGSLGEQQQKSNKIQVINYWQPTTQTHTMSFSSSSIILEQLDKRKATKLTTWHHPNEHHSHTIGELDSSITIEPSQAEIAPDQQAQFTCSLSDASSEDPNLELVWMRNGRRLPLRWHQTDSAQNGRFEARRGPAANQFMLLISPTRLEDDNSTFSCQLAADADHELARDSPTATLRVVERNQQVKVEVNMGEPIDGLESRAPPRDIHANQNRTQITDLGDQQAPNRRQHVSSLRETLEDLYLLIRPSLVVVLALLALLMLALVQFLWGRRKARHNSYTKHQFTSGSSAGSGGGIAHSAALLADPLLSSLMGRSLSGANELATGKKSSSRSYRGQMRKVANCDNQMLNNDLLDGYFGHHQPANLAEQLNFDSALPNLYNQSLLAREQHQRTLLQASEHMRSMSNLNQKQGSKYQPPAFMRFGHNSSQLNLPLSFNLNRNSIADNQRPLLAMDNSGQLLASSIFPGRLDEHYQLVNCSSISPSSSSSAAVATNNADQSRPARDSNSLNHYSTIETSEEQDDNDDRYEQVDLEKCNNNQAAKMRANNQTSFGRNPNDGSNQKQSSLRSSLISSSNSSSSGCGDSNTTTSSLVSDFNARYSTKRGNSTARFPQNQPRQQQAHNKDQLSPYAVSSICTSLNQQQPPPMSSEAMRALNEQFDISQLMLMDDSLPITQVLNQFEASPPPPPNSSPPEKTQERRQQQARTKTNEQT